MVEYKCERCHYVAKHKGNIKKHLQRKNPCRPIHSDISVEELLEKLNKPKNGFACNKCNKIFNSRQGKYQHQKRCKQELVVFEEKNKDNEEIQELKNELKLMKELFIEKMQSQNITNNNNNITKIKNQQNNTNLFISFNDKENIHKLIKGCQETILQLEKVRSKDKCFSIYIDAAHFNPEHPETHNIKLTNLKPDYKLIDIRDDEGKWKKEPQKEIFNNLINSSKDFITDIVKDSNPKFDNTININDYEGEDAKEKFILYCNETEYKKKLNNIAKSEIYNKSKEIKNESK
mgnify:FL=1|tara:strand:+ start:3177 stop:4046 length:870 start_codon:yes stop_codon:yes gene_type:complete